MPGLSNRYINKRNNLKESYDEVGANEAITLTKNFVIDIINKKDCPYRDVHVEIIKAFAQFGGEVKDATSSTTAGAGSGRIL